MEPHEQNWVRLPLDGATNVRELGGYPTITGGQTKFHRFLRSDDLGRLTEYDKRFLYNYGVRAVIDLRDASEAEAMPDCTIGPDVVYVNIPLLDFNAAEVSELERKFSAESFSMEPIYQRILENFEGIRQCFRFIADAPKGCVLFHCAVGKDRTGVLAMLLLSLAGVDKWDIVANYAQTCVNLMRSSMWQAQWDNPKAREWRHLLDSAPSVMEQTYDLLDEEHEGIENYLLECGVPDEDVAAVRRRLVEP